MIGLVLSAALTASPSLQLVPVAVAPQPAAEAQSPWTGERGRNRIMGLALTGGAGALTLTGLALLLSAVSLGSVPYATPYCDPRFGPCYGYGYAYAPSPVPYLLAAVLVLAGAGTAAGFGIPALLKGFRQD